MRTPPLEVVLSWPTPNYVNPETRGPANQIFGILLLVVASVIVGIRLYARRKISNGFGLDDVLIVLAMIPASAFVIAGIYAEYEFGWNRHVWDLEPKNIPGVIQLALANLILFNFATALTKLSMLALTYRLSEKLKVPVIGSGLFIVASCVTFIIVTLGQCTPISDYWTVGLKEKNCIDESAHLLAAGILNTATDFFVVLLPLFIMRQLKALPRRQLMIVIGLFAVGLIASFAGVVRTYFTHVMTSSDDFDTTWHAWASFLASMFELYLGIICASIPATKPFWSKYWPRLISSSTFLTRSSDDDVERGGLSHKKGRHGSVPTFHDTESLEYQGHQRDNELSMAPVKPAAPLSPLNLNKPLPSIAASLDRAKSGATSHAHVSKGWV